MPSSRKSKSSSAAKQLAQSKANKSKPPKEPKRGISSKNPGAIKYGKIEGNDYSDWWQVDDHSNAKGYIADRRFRSFPSRRKSERLENYRKSRNK